MTTTYVLDIATPLTMVIAETTSTDTIYYLHGLDLIAQSDGTDTEYFLYDGLGSVRQLSNGAEHLHLTQTYDPYGLIYVTAGTDSTAFGFTGEYEDSNGLVYLRARYYQPGMGRFLNADPSRQEVMLYGYAYENPINRVDPTGLCTSPFTFFEGAMAASIDIYDNTDPIEAGFRAMLQECKQSFARSVQVASIPRNLLSL